MWKTLTIIAFSIIFAVFIALAFTNFLAPQNKMRYSDCVLMQNIKTKAVDCFGCYNNICKDAPTDWEIYAKPEIGIPYACFKSDTGCQLAQ